MGGEITGNHKTRDEIIKSSMITKGGAVVHEQVLKVEVEAPAKKPAVKKPSPKAPAAKPKTAPKSGPKPDTKSGS